MAYEPINDFFIDEFTTDCTVPLYWNDTGVLEGSAEWSDTTTVKGIYSNPYERLDLGIAGIDAAQPTVAFKTADVPGAMAGNEITINGTTYEVGTPQPTGDGLTVCDLIRQV